MKKHRFRSRAAAVLQMLTVAVLILFISSRYYQAAPLRELWWLSAALLIGFVRDRWTTLLVALLPWTIGVAAAWLTGAYASLQYWELVSLPSEALGSLAVGIFGITVGLLLRRWNRMPDPHSNHH